MRILEVWRFNLLSLASNPSDNAPKGYGPQPGVTGDKEAGGLIRSYPAAEFIFCHGNSTTDPVEAAHDSNPGRIFVPSALTPSNSPPSIPNASKISGATCVVKTLCVNFCAFVIRGLLTKQATFLSSALRPPCSSTFFLEVV